MKPAKAKRIVKLTDLHPAAQQAVLALIAANKAAKADREAK